MTFNPIANRPCIMKKGTRCHQDFSEFIGRRSCFIACPNSNEVSSEKSAIKSVLDELKIDCIISADYQLLNQEIVCSKICKNIIGSTFCIALLTDVSPRNSEQKQPTELIADSLKEPNANVYFEYGLMTALNKDIIPIQKRNQKLKFDIQNLDLILYDEITQSNMDQFRDLIKKGIKSMADTSIVNKVATKYYKNIEEELKRNYIVLVSNRGIIRSLDSDYFWYDAYDRYNSFTYVVFEMLKRRGALLEFEKEKEIAESYEHLEYFTRVFNSKLQRFLNCKNNPALTDYQKKEFYNQLCVDLEKKLYECIDKIEKTLILLNEENKIYIKSMKGS